MTFELRNVSTNCAVGLGTVINGERSLMPGKKVDVLTMEDMEKARKIVANFRHLLTLTETSGPVVEALASTEVEETVAPTPEPVEDGTEVAVEEAESEEEVVADPNPETEQESVEDESEVAVEETEKGGEADNVESAEESDGAVSDPAPVRKKRGRKPRRSEG